MESGTPPPRPFALTLYVQTDLQHCVFLTLLMPRGVFLSSVQGIAGTVRTRDLTEDDLTKLREEVDKYTTEGDLRRYVNLNIKRLKEIGCYRGRRHINVRVITIYS
jgi:hypothetical protein